MTIDKGTENGGITTVSLVSEISEPEITDNV
jgi:hypothetical protein